MTAIELQKPSSLGHVQASLAVTLAHRVFENISKQYRLGLVSTGTLSHDLNRFWQTKVLRREDPYLKVGEVNDPAHKGASEYVWALKDINLQNPLSLGHGQTSLAAALAHRVFKVEQGDVVGIIGRNAVIGKFLNDGKTALNGLYS